MRQGAVRARTAARRGNWPGMHACGHIAGPFDVDCRIEPLLPMLTIQRRRDDRTDPSRGRIAIAANEASARRLHPLLYHAWLVVPFAVILLCYLPVWTTEYGFSEDYRLLDFYQHGATNRTLIIAEGRPVQALWTNLAFYVADTIPALVFIRFANTLFLAFAGVAVARTWIAAGGQRLEAGLIGVAMMTLPPFQVLAGAAATGIGSVAVFTAVLAALVTWTASAGGTGPTRFALLGLAAVVLCISVTGYQPSAMLFWTMAAVLLLVPDHSPEAFRRVLMAFAVVGLVAIAAGFVAYLVGRGLFPIELAGKERSSLSINPVQKFLWFFTNPMVQSLNLWRLYPDRFLALAMALLIEAGLILHLTRSAGARLRFAAAMVLLPLSYLPSLMVREDWAAFRTQIALVSTVFVYLVITLRTQRQTKRNWIYALGLPALALFGSWSAFTNVRTFFVEPQARELAIVRQEMAAVPAAYVSIGVVRAAENQTLAPFALWDEFGRASTSFPWGAATLPWLVLRELRPSADTASYRVYDTGIEHPPVDTVIDWGRVLRAASAASPP